MDNEKLKKYEEITKEIGNPYEELNYERTNLSEEIINDFPKLENKEVAVAGRIMAIRKQGNICFADLVDEKGKIQLYIKSEEFKDYKIFIEKNFIDRGDIIGAKGIVTKTKRGEISVLVKEIKLLAKALNNLPEKFHGLKDTEIIYRKRYLDLIMNSASKDVFIKRSKIVAHIRDFMNKRGFIEVETPILQPIYGGGEAKPFKTHHNELDMDMYLRIAPELYLKKLIVGGLERIYEIGKLFRNEGIDTKHNPEYTSMEIYWAYKSADDMMKLTEEIITSACETVLGKTKIEYADTTLDFTAPFERITMVDAIKKYGDIDVNKLSIDEMKKIAEKHNIKIEKHMGKGHLIELFFEEFAEKKIIQPTFVIDYPVEISPLAKRKKDNKEITDRFELFAYGRELCNGYSELNDPIDQKKRFEEQTQKRKLGYEEAHMMDLSFIDALEYGMPPTGGVGLGIDRLVMFLTNSQSIKDVILFPTLRKEEN